MCTGDDAKTTKKGAIPFCKTSVPQTLISYECVNPVFGVTRNPHNAEYTPGGSSGGEAVLLAASGSCAGFGTDIGGSLRIPAHFSGCFALKPTVRYYCVL
jgi:amidase